MNEFDVLDLEVLEFDRDNPRLPTNVKGSDDDSILKYLATKTRIENLMSSIGENGFFRGEAIVVMPYDAKYTVIEGNRRLAALRLLLNPTLVKVPRIERVAKEAVNKPTEVPVYIVQSRDDTLQYLGFRHISGVQRWDPLAKARYLKSLFDRTRGDPLQRYASVAREIGSTGPTVRRNLDALAAYEIVERNDFYDIAEMGEETFQFGTFYTAVSNTDIGNFINTSHGGNARHPIVNPEVIHEEHLEELVRYMFEEDARGNTKLVESRNISKLGAALNNPDSLNLLRLGRSLDAAYRLTPHGRDDFMRHMNQAIEELKQSNANLYAVERDDQEAGKVVSEALKIIYLSAERLGVAADA